ncbi:hypothetical protein [Virgisporangium aurantiacum]|nr:hypothetical protein [Virgisporangium aurantiacum]
MTLLEKRCRRVVALLPRAERDARGEEVLGVLMDLSAGRTRPPLAEVVAVAGLSLRLRFATRANRFVVSAPVLVASLLMAVAPWPVGPVIRLLPSPPPGIGGVLGFVAIIGLWLAAGTVWLFGLRRTAAVLWLALAGATAVETVRTEHVVIWYLSTFTLPVALAAAALVVAVRRGVPPPEPRRAWLLLMLGTAAAWVATLALPQSVLVSPVTMAVATTVAVLAGIVAVTGRTRASGILPAAVVAVVTLAGWAPAWVGVVVLTFVAGTLISRRTAPVDQSTPSTSLAT